MKSPKNRLFRNIHLVIHGVLGLSLSSAAAVTSEDRTSQFRPSNIPISDEIDSRTRFQRTPEAELNKLPNVTCFIPASDTQKSQFPTVDVHVGMGFASGLRLGIRAQVIENLSFEISYGTSAVIYGGAELLQFYGAGANFHFSKTSLFMFSLLLSYRTFVSHGGERSFMISPNFGILSTPDVKFRFFLRGGFFIHHNFAADETHIGPNIDLGIGWSFF